VLVLVACEVADRVMKDFNALRWGVAEDMDGEFRRVTIISNVVYLLMLGIVLLYLLINLRQYISPPPGATATHYIPLFLITVSLLCLALNRMGKLMISKIMFVLTWISLTILMGPAIRGTTEFSYISTALYAVVSSVLVHVLFSWRRERAAYFFMLSLAWAILLFFVEYLDYFRPEGEQNVLFQQGFWRWRLIIIMLALFISGTVIYIIRVNHQLNESLILRNETIEKQNQQLAEQREKLVALAIQLREKVDTSSAQLSEQYMKLTEYTYFNSHILRAPVSRIRGLISLLTMKLTPQEEFEVRHRLSKSMEELDNAIKEITEKLNEGDPRGS